MQLKQEDILKLLMKNEEAVEQLYVLLAKTFPTYAIFWLERAQDEHRHAEMFRRLMDRAQDGMYFFDENHFTTEAIETFNKFVQEATKRVEAGILDIVTATDAVLAIEEALLEEEVFDQFRGSTKHLQQIIYKIKEDCVLHHSKIKQFRDNELLDCAS